MRMAQQRKSNNTRDIIVGRVSGWICIFLFFFFFTFFASSLCGTKMWTYSISGTGALRASYTRELNFIVRFITWFISFCQISTVIHSASSLSLHLASNCLLIAAHEHPHQAKYIYMLSTVRDHTWSHLSRSLPRKLFSMAFIILLLSTHLRMQHDSVSLFRQDFPRTHTHTLTFYWWYRRSVLHCSYYTSCH